MSSFQIGFLVVVGVAIATIILTAIFVKSKKVERPPDFRLDINEPDISIPETTAANDVAEQVAQPDTETYSTINIDPIKLREWYLKAAQKHRKKLGKIGWWIGFYLIFQGVALLIAVPFLLSSGAAEVPGAGVLLFLVLLGVGLYVWVIWYYLSNSAKSVTNVISSNKYVLLGDHQFPAIWDVCTDLMNKMELDKYELKIYYVKSSAVEASVVVDENTIYMLLSRGLINYYRTNPKDVESILGHEFGHVYQGDTKMMMVNRNTIRIPAILQMISLGLAGITVIGALMSDNQQLTPQVGTNFILVSYFFQLSALRKGAEYLADIASVAFVNDSSLPQLIKKYMPDRETFNYPSSRNRIAFLEKLDKYVEQNKSIQL